MTARTNSAIRWKVFAAAAVAINLIAFLMVRLAPRPAVETGAALDVAVTIPALYFLLIVRGGVQPLVTMLPLCLLGVWRATYLAQGVAWTRPAVGACVELALVTLIAVRVRRGLASVRGENSPDALERMEVAAREVVPSRRLTAVLASEMAVFYYAFAGWRRAPHVPLGTRVFPIHQQSGVTALFDVLAGVSVMEAALVHLVVMRWSVAVAWALTALSGYGTVWLTAMARAFVLRPLLVEGGELVVRSGMMWTVRVPLTLIASIERGGANCGLRVPVASEPTVSLRLSEAVSARGMYGMTRQVTSIGLAVDDPEGLVRALTHGV